MQLREAKPLSVLDHHHRGVGHVDTDLDDRGGHQHVDLAALETAHNDLFLVGVQAPVQQPHAQAGEWAGAQLLMHLDGGFQAGFCSGIGLLHGLGKEIRRFALSGGFARRRRRFDTGFGIVVREIQLRLVFFGSLDDRVDDVRLALPRHLPSDKIPHFLGALSGDAPGNDGRAARRELVQHAHVQVAVEGERQGARDGRGGHYQHVGLWLVGFLHQLEALHHAETVLLVDHHQAQAVELYLLFDECVGADDQLRLAAVDHAAGAALAVLVQRAGQ